MTPIRYLSILPAVALVAACGGGDDATSTDPAPQIVVEGDARPAEPADVAGEPTTGTDDDTTATDEGDISDEDAALAFAQCMRDNGVPEWPDPTTGADGSIDLFGGQLGPGGGIDPDALDSDALETCAPLVEGASFLPGGGDGFGQEQQDQFLELAQCLRDQGLDVDDPDLSNFRPGGGAAAGGLFGENFDPNDPANADALEACAGIFTGFGG